MNGIGGDGFWIVKRPGEAPQGIFAGGQAAALATPDWYADQGHEGAIPARGGLAALTVPGTIGGWEAALGLAETRLPLSRLLAPAIGYAQDGIAVTGNQHRTTRDKLDGLRDVPGFAEHFLLDGDVPAPGARLTQTALGQTLAQLAEHGLRSYYTGPIAEAHARFLEANGSPLRLQDFHDYAAEGVTPLELTTSQGTIWNMIPPTQGVSSLMILGLFDRLGVTEAEGFDHIHGLIEATKQAFIQRNAELGDHTHMATPAQDWLEGTHLDALAARIDRARALPWPYEPKAGDTIWMGACDRDGTMVSFIQSVFWEFGSGLTCPETGSSSRTAARASRSHPARTSFAPGKRPFHTLNPAMAELPDGRVMAYGTMGGEGQPQTQSAVFTRAAQFGQDLQAAVTAPRWLLGKTWGTTRPR